MSVYGTTRNPPSSLDNGSYYQKKRTLPTISPHGSAPAGDAWESGLWQPPQCHGAFLCPLDRCLPSHVVASAYPPEAQPPCRQTRPRCRAPFPDAAEAIPADRLSLAASDSV